MVHNRNARGDGHGLLLVMGDDDEGGSGLLLDVHQLELGVLPQLGVERAEGLVEQQQLRRLGERPRQGHALALAAGDLMRLAPGEVLEATSPSISDTALVDSLPGQPFAAQPEAMFSHTDRCGNSA